MNFSCNTNFCRVFELPNEYPHEYCFGGVKHPVEIKMVNWFYPVPSEIKSMTEEEWPQWEEKLINFVKRGGYLQKGKDYLILTEFGKAVVIQKDEIK